MLHVPTDLARHAIEFRGKLPQSVWSLSDILNVIRWRRSLIFWCVVAVFVPALVYVAVAPPKFTATAVLMTDTKRSPVGGSAAADTSVDMVVVESQVETLKSDKIALAVIDKLRLWEDAEFVPQGPTPWAYIVGLLTGPGAKRPKTNDVKRQIAMGAFSRGLRVERAGRSYITDISFTSTDPQKAAVIANAIAEAYIVDQLSAKLQIAQRSSDWIENRVGELRQRASDAAKALADFKSANGISASADSSVSGVPPASAPRLRELEGAAQSARTAYETFLNRYTQSVQIQQQAFPVTEARVLAEALPPLSNSTPKTNLILLLAIVAGGALGLIGAFAREYVERLVRSPRQIERELRVRVLGTIPRVKRRTLLARAGPLHLIEAHTPHTPFGKARPLALAGESLRGIKVALDRAGGGQGYAIGISSPRPGSGKTTLAYNLAMLSARCGGRTLLIDGDLRRLSLTRSLRLQRQPGLVSLTAGQADISECVAEHHPNLHFLGETAGFEASHPSEVLGSAAMSSTIDRLRKSYDYIIIDLPPLLDVVDVRASASAIAAFVLVTEWGRTSVEDLDRALASCDVVVERLLGVVVNKLAAAEINRRY